jgi:hypothetical protein
LTLAEHLAAAAEFDEGAIAELLGPPFPPGTEHAWSVFTAVRATQGATSSGPRPIDDHALYWYQRVRGHRLTPFDIRLVFAANEVYMAHVAEQLKALSGDPPDTSDPEPEPETS